MRAPTVYLSAYVTPTFVPLPPPRPEPEPEPEPERCAVVAPTDTYGPHPTEVRKRHALATPPTELHRERVSITELSGGELAPVAELAAGQAPGFTVHAAPGTRDREQEQARSAEGPWSALRGTLSRDRGGTVSVRDHHDAHPVPPLAATPLPRWDTLRRTELASSARWYRWDREQERHVLVARLSAAVTVPFDALTPCEWSALVADGWGATILPPVATTVTARGGRRSKLTPEQQAERKREQARERKRRQRERARRERDAELAREHDAELAAQRDAERHAPEREHTAEWQNVTH